MKKKKFITRVILLLLLVTGCLTFRSIQAAEEGNSLTLKFSLPEKDPEAYDADDVLADTPVYDLYYIAPIKWDGAGDGVHADSTKYYIPYTEIESDYQSLFTGFKDSNDDINVSEREGSLVNTALKEYGLNVLANDIATKIFGGTTQLTPDVASVPINQPKTGLEDGLYLAIVRGSSATTKDKYLKTRTEETVDGDQVVTETKYYSYINSKYHEYDFDPLLVFLKSSENVADLTAKMKYTENPRYDDLLIVKELTSIGGKGTDEFSFEPVTFVYEVTAYDPKDTTKVIYQDVASITISSDSKLIGQTIAERIPVGAKVEVTEIYGRSYTLTEVEGNPLSTTHIIVSARDDNGEHLIDDETKLYQYENSDGKPIFAYTYFKNAFDYNPLEGYGIDNMYRYGEDGWFYDGKKVCNVDEPETGGQER